MIVFLWRLLFGSLHVHKWEVLKEVEVYPNESSEMTCGTNWVLQCSVCGDLKNHRSRSWG